jgi:probable F420-dependent oxidoreductase
MTDERRVGMMRYGIHLAGSGPFASMERIDRLAVRAEELGFDSVWLSDHVVTPERFRSPYPYAQAAPFTPDSARVYYEPIVALAWVAGRTRRVRLGISVLVVPQRNPLLTAKQLATLDDLSGGRLVVGVGVGWLREEFAALHAPFRARGATTNAYLRLFRQLWSGEPTHSTSPPYRFRAVSSQPVPTQGPGIPIWVGGHSEQALRRTVELGDAWHAIRLDVERFRECAERLRSLAASHGRPTPSLTTLCELSLDGETSPDDWRLSGSHESIVAKLDRFAEAGCEEVVLSVHPRESTTAMVETMEVFASDIRPSVRGATGV